MERLDSYIVDLKGMPSDTVSYRWRIDDDFFSAVQGPEIQQGLLDVALRVKRTSVAYELKFQYEGTVKVVCDRCLELMDLPISGESVLRAKLGDEFADDGDLVTVPEEDGHLDVSWYIYELLALEIPIRHVHEDGECACQSYDEAGSSESPSGQDEVDDTPIDPRWNELKKILNNNKK